MSLAPYGKLLVKTRKEYHASRRKGSESDKAEFQKNRGQRENVAVRYRVFLKKRPTKSSRVQKRGAQDVVGDFFEFRTRNNPQLFQEKSMFPLDKDGKQPMMWQKVVRSGW
jgi:hypothetical protein